MKAIANEQAFQSIYLDPDATQWQDRIVFHEPIFQTEIPGVIALKSLELENVIGLVIAAPLNILRHFKELVRESDLAEGWGQEEAATIVAKLVKAAKDLGAVIAYEQFGMEVPRVPPEQIEVAGESEDPEENEDEAEAFFDPLTKRRIVKEGPHYFDPSLVTLKDVEEKMKRRSKEKAKARALPANPARGAYPDGITDVGREIWDKLIPANEAEVYKYKSPSERWDYATYLYENRCRELGVPDYKLLEDSNPSIVFKKLNSSKQQATDYLDTILVDLRRQGLARQKPTREIAFDVRQMGDNNFYLTTSRSLELDGLATIQQVLDFLAKHHNFYLAKTQKENGFKPINDTTKLTFSQGKPKHIKIYLTQIVPPKEAQILCKSEDITHIKNALMKLLNMWVKTGRLVRRG